jgi:hypothetical protein
VFPSLVAAVRGSEAAFVVVESSPISPCAQEQLPCHARQRIDLVALGVRGVPENGANLSVECDARRAHTATTRARGDANTLLSL